MATLPFLRQAGFSPVALAPPSGPLARALAANAVPLIPFACRRSDGSRKSLEVLRAELAGLLDELRPDLVHANSLSMGRMLGRD